MPRGNQSTYSVFKNLSKVRIRQPYCGCLFVNVYVSYGCLQVNFSKQSLLFNLSSKSLTLKCSPLETIDVKFHVITGNTCMGTQRTACIRLAAKYMHKDIPNMKLSKNSLFFPSTRKVAFCFLLFSMAWHINVCIWRSCENTRFVGFYSSHPCWCCFWHVYFSSQCHTKKQMMC